MVDEYFRRQVSYVSWLKCATRGMVLVAISFVVGACSGPEGAPDSGSTGEPLTSTTTAMSTRVESEGNKVPDAGTTGPVASEDATALTLSSPPSTVDYGIYSDEVLLGGQVVRNSIEYANFVASCYAEYGISATVVGPGELEVAGGGQTEARNRATVECDQRAVESGLIGLGISDNPPPDVLEVWYRGFTEIAYPCLRENGFPTSEPPSMSVWVEAYPNVWTPHSVVGSTLPPEELEEVLEVCPQDIGLLLIELGQRDR